MCRRSGLLQERESRRLLLGHFPEVFEKTRTGGVRTRCLTLCSKNDGGV